MKTKEQFKTKKHTKLFERIEAIEEKTDVWLRDLESILSDPEIILWKDVDIEPIKRVLHIFGNPQKGATLNSNKSIQSEFISSIKSAQYNLLNHNPKSKDGLIQLSESIKQIKVGLKGVPEIPKRIDFVEKDFFSLQERMDQLTHQKGLLNTCLEGLRHPSTSCLMELVQRVSGYTEKQEMERALSIIALMSKITVNDEDGFMTVLSDIKNIDKELSAFEIGDEKSFLIFSQIQQTKFRTVIHGMIQSALITLDTIKQKNDAFVIEHKKEKKNLLTSGEETTLENICREYEVRARDYKDFLLSVSRGSDLPKRLKIAKSLVTTLRQVTDDLSLLDDQFKTKITDPASMFPLRPSLFSEKMYDAHLGPIKIFFLAPINLIRKLFGKKVLEKDTVKHFIERNTDYQLDETPIKMKMRVNGFIRKEKLPETLGKVLEESFLRYIKSLVSYIGNFRQGREFPSVNLSIKRLEKQVGELRN